MHKFIHVLVEYGNILPGYIYNHSRHRIILNLTKPIKIFDVDYGTL